MKRRLLLLASSVFGALSGCETATMDYGVWETGEYNGYSDYTGWAYDDIDNDGFDESEDCDDTDPAVNPDAEEVCDDGIDNDCDDLTDEDDVEDCQ